MINLMFLHTVANSRNETCGEAWDSLAGLKSGLIDVARDSREVPRRGGITGVGHTGPLHTLTPHLPTKIADQVTEMCRLLNYWTCECFIGHFKLGR